MLTTVEKRVCTQQKVGEKETETMKDDKGVLFGLDRNFQV